MKLPKTFKNYKGEDVEIRWPNGDLIHSKGDVYLFKTRDTFSVVYGLQENACLSFEEAIDEFDNCVMHQEDSFS
jgi:hypothetical protein